MLSKKNRNKQDSFYNILEERGTLNDFNDK